MTQIQKNQKQLFDIFVKIKKGFIITAEDIDVLKKAIIGVSSKFFVYQKNSFFQDLNPIISEMTLDIINKREDYYKLEYFNKVFRWEVIRCMVKLKLISLSSYLDKLKEKNKEEAL